MKLGNHLMMIAEATGEQKEELKEQFLEKIQDHREEKLLRECLVAACAGHKYISFGRNILPPEELKNEGFVLKPASCGYNYCFCGN